MNRGILVRDGQAVKGKIYAAGLTPLKVANRAGIARSTLSDYFAGRRRNPETQALILKAFNHLTGLRNTMLEFWGSLARRREEAA